MAGGIKRDKLDRVFSDLIRERENWYCQNCHNNFRHSDSGYLDCAHIMGRRNVATRWHPVNCVSLCRKCHLFFTENTFDFYDWVVGYYGQDRLDELRRVAKTPVKWSKQVREGIYQHYRAELKRMEALRAEGCMKRIEIVVPDLMHDFAEEILPMRVTA